MDKRSRKSNHPPEVKSKHLNISVNKRPEDQSAARLFESTSNMDSVDERTPAETEDSRLQKQNLAIIRNILEMFNLDETKKKYESQNVVEFVLDPNDFGYDCSLSTTRVRQRLCDLMGTDVIRLNDKRYFQKLTQRLQDEYETIMDKQEDARAASEDERLRRLMLEGIIDAPNDYRAVVHGHENKHSKKKKRRKIRRHTSSNHRPCDTMTSDDESQSKTRKEVNSSNYSSRGRTIDPNQKAIDRNVVEDVVTQIEMLSNSRHTPTMSPSSTSGRSGKTAVNRKSPGKKVSIDEKENERVGQPLNKEMHARLPPHHDSALQTSCSSSTHRKSRRVKSAAARISHWETGSGTSDDEDGSLGNEFDTQSLPGRQNVSKLSKYSTQEPERVSRLRTEETVAGLYSIAEEIVSPVKADDLPSRKVNIAKPKKMVVSYS